MSPISLCIIVLLTSSATAERWSRQLTSDGTEGEWIPLQSTARQPQPQAQSRVLVEPQFPNPFFPQESFPDYVAQGGARQVFIQSPNSVPQQNFFSRNPQQPIRLTLSSQFNPLPHSFTFPRQMPYNEFRQSIQAQFHQPHLVVPPSQLNNQIYNNQPDQQKGVVVAPQNIPQQPAKPEITPFPTASTERTEPPKPTLPTLKNKLKKEYSEFSAVNQGNMQNRVQVNPTTPVSSTNVEKEEVQLLYVPLETLQNKRFDLKQFLKNPPKQIDLRDSIGSPGQINNQLFPQTTPAHVNHQTQLNNIKYDLFQQQQNSQLLQGAFTRDPNFNHPPSVTPSPFNQATHPVPLLSTPKSKKLKAHQPPLAVYMFQNGKEKARLSDVLTVLKESSSVSVLDSIPLNAPKIFIGPNNLKTPVNVAKFELPYLSSIDGTRIPRRIENLPFFVAPLSYKAPNGFAKIPFPAPHVGSVIVNPYMRDADEAPTSLVFDSPSTINTFPQSTTEAFRTTIKETVPTKPTNFNYFPSTTSSQSSPTSFPSQRPSSVSFSTVADQFNSVFSTRNPEQNTISSSRAPSSAFPTSAFPTSPRPTVSFFGFSEPTFNTHPTTTHKPSSLNYDTRGHYITNAAIEASRQPQRQYTQFKETIGEKPNTSPIPASHIPNGQFNFINPFILRNPYEPKDYGPGFRGNDIRHYNVVERPVVQNINQFPPPQQKYPQFPSNQHRPEIQKINFGLENTFSSPSLPVETSPTAGPIAKPTVAPVHEQYNTFEDQQQQFGGVRNQQPEQYNAYGNKEVIGGFVPSFNQYDGPNANFESSHVTQENEYYETETPVYEATSTTTSTTTTTTTTTPAPTTRSYYTRRPINRGRPRYTTTPKAEGDETTIRPTTRRTPLRERRPTTYRSRITTTTESSVDDETTKKPREYFTKFSSRQKSQDEENDTTTESTASTTRNPRFRSRGKVQFKNSDNFEGSDYAKRKKDRDHARPDDLAYQRDVLHQNYPVTVSEKFSTLEVRTTMASPSSTPGSNIRIYETTGSTQSPISSTYETHTSEQPYYENEAVFQREPEKFLTHPDEYVEINGRHGLRTTPIQHHSTSNRQENVVSSTTARYEKPQTVSEEYFEIKTKVKLNNVPEEHKHEKKVEAEDPEDLPIKYALDVVLTEAPMPKFRTKLKNRPKLLHSLNVPKRTDDDNQNLSSDTFVTSTKKAEETTTERHEFTRRVSPSSVTHRPSSVTHRSSSVTHIPSSVTHRPSSVTHRPAFNSRRTTMRIEEIEEDLKARRTQLRYDGRTSTHKAPVYIPEASSTTASPSNEENDVTTNRNKIIRRRPTRPTTASSVDSPRAETTTEKAVNTKVRRVRVRTRVRKPTTENGDNEAIHEEKTTTPIPRVSPQSRYSTKNRQRYFKKPISLADKNDQSSENVDDQASFDSINRPEIIKFNPETGNHEYVEYNIENGKAETHWSPKINSNVFRTPFNPNFITEERNKDNSDYGSKLSVSEIDLREPEIITAGNIYEGDILITVTPPTNNLNSQTTTSDSRKQKEYIVEKPSTFETFLEEVMRNLEEQNEPDYMTVVKHEGGEIGEIPPESTSQTKPENDATEPQREIQSTTPTLPTTVAQKRYFSTAPDVIMSSTERKARRRGGWRKISVRPVQRDVLESAETQYYKQSKNELLADKKAQNKYEKTKPGKLNDDVVIKPQIPEETTVREVLQTTQEATTVPPKQEIIENTESFKDVEEQTDYPDLIAMEVSEDDVTYAPRKENTEKATTEIENNTEYVISRTDQPIRKVKENKTESVEEKELKVEQTTVVKEEKENITETTTGKVEELIITTTEQPIEERKTDKPAEEAPAKSFLEVMEELLGSDNEQQITKTVETDKKEEKTVAKEVLETTTSGFKFFDPRAVISTSVSTEISHETEICFRGKCIKTKKLDNKK